MKKILTLFFLFIVFSSQTGFCSDTSSIKYMPLHVGDRWVYNSTRWSLPGGNYYWASTIVCTHSGVFNGRTYYFLTSTDNELMDGYFRVDSITGSLYLYDQSNSCPFYYYEKLYDSLAAVVNDSNKNCAQDYKCTSFSSLVFANRIWAKKSYSQSYQGVNYGSSSTKTYVKYIGFYSISGSGWGGGGYGGGGSTLKGCTINGITYGDTTFAYTGVTALNDGIPFTYNLCQNYPNPFNPVTNIKFDIPKSSFVKISVFDIAGKEIETLVNQDLKPGTYKTFWNASAYSSGIYFCKIQAGKFNQIRKMILLK